MLPHALFHILIHGRMDTLSCRDQTAPSPSSPSRSLDPLDKPEVKPRGTVLGWGGLGPGALGRFILYRATASCAREASAQSTQLPGTHLLGLPPLVPPPLRFMCQARPTGPVTHLPHDVSVACASCPSPPGDPKDLKWEAWPLLSRDPPKRLALGRVELVAGHQ